VGKKEMAKKRVGYGPKDKAQNNCRGPAQQAVKMADGCFIFVPGKTSPATGSL
jgi:hypothetical protein